MKKIFISVLLVIATLPMVADSPEEAQDLHNKGREYLNANDIAKGREYTLKAAEMRERLFGKLSKEYITSLNNYALSFFIAGELPQALEYQTEVVALCRQMNTPHPDEGMYLINLGRIYHAMDKDDNAVALMEEALPKVEKFSQNYEYILNFLGMVYMDRNDNPNVNRIMGLMEEHNQHELEKECNDPQCHLDRAEYFASAGQPALAREEYMAVFALPLTNDQKSDAYERYARFLTSQGDYAQAGEYYNMAADFSEKTGGISEKSTGLYRHAGLCLFIGKEYDKAIDAHRKVISAVDTYGFSEKFKSSSLQGLGNSYNAKKEYSKAIDTFRSWIEHLKKYGHEGEADFAKAFERLASSEKFAGEYDSSLADYDTAIALFDALGMHDEALQAKSGRNMCLAYAGREMEDTSESEDAVSQREGKLRATLQESINTLEQGGDYLGKMSRAQSLATIAGCYAQLGDFGEAVRYYEMYLPAVREALAEDFLLKSARDRQLTWQRELGTLTEMEALLALIPQDPDLYARMSKLVYEGNLLSKGILLSSDVEFDKVLNRHGSREMKLSYFRIKRNMERIALMKEQHMPVEEILKLIRETDEMQLALARESAEYADFMQYLRINSADIVAALGNDGVAVEFVTLDTDILQDNDLVVAVLLSKEFPSGLAVPVAFVKDIKAMIEDKEKFSNLEYGKVIWGALLQALEGKKRVYFAPDGLLNNIGVEYLIVGDLPMSEQYEMSRVSSTREVARSHIAQPLVYASVFGGIDYLGEGGKASDKKRYSKYRNMDGVSFDPLEETQREADEIVAILKDHTKKTFEYTGTKASEAEFLSQEKIRPLGLLHVATHGAYLDTGKLSESDAMNNSLLAFAGADLSVSDQHNDGIVTAADIAAMSLQDCDLVVLSACESGLGKLGTDGVFGLQRGFKNAGVRSLLVSLNEVADAVTADMMISFYRNLFSGDGMSKRDALRKAQAETRESNPGDDTWASFILIDSFD